MEPHAAAIARFCPACGHPMDAAGVCSCAGPAEPAPTAAEHLRPIRATLALYFSLLTLSIGVGAYAIFAPDHSARGDAYLDLAATGGLSLIVLIACIAGRRDLAPLLSRTGPVGWYALAPIISIATFGFAWLVCHTASWLFGLHSARYSVYQDAGFPWWSAFLLISLQPGIFEELAFRGLTQTWLGRVLGRRETLAATALLFATIHLNPIVFVHVSVMGVVLGLVRARSGSVYPGMLLHACHNGIVVAIALLTEGPA